MDFFMEFPSINRGAPKLFCEHMKKKIFRMLHKLLICLIFLILLFMYLTFNIFTLVRYKLTSSVQKWVNQALAL